MVPLLFVAVVLLGAYVLLTQTLFKRAKCKGNAAMSGKTVIITGETGIKRSLYQTDRLLTTPASKMTRCRKCAYKQLLCVQRSADFPFIGFFTSSYEAIRMLVFDYDSDSE